jgi:NAD(P)-dependent dehydrogenase (short-subunit alcohol dehydrogenase family)
MVDERTTGGGPGADPLFSVAGKAVVVTGGSAGIGRAVAVGFVERGADVVIVGRSADGLRRAADEIGSASASGSCQAVVADASTVEGAAGIAVEAERVLGRLDVLVNNAGRGWLAPLDADGDGWEKVMALNVAGVFRVTRACLPSLRRSASPTTPARVVNIGSIDGIRVPAIETYAYSAGKAALHHLTRLLAQRLGPEHVTVNVVAPGSFATRMTEGRDDAMESTLAAVNPLGRLGRAEDVVGACVYLASAAGSWVTGAVLPVDGGSLVRALPTDALHEALGPEGVAALFEPRPADR